MPKLTVDYSKTIMYKIVSKDLNIKDVYVGHTTDFTKRKCNHKINCNHEMGKAYNHKVYQFIRDNGGWDSFEMIEIEKHPCNDGNEARSRERFWFESLNSTLNTIYPVRSHEEYSIVYHEKIKEMQKNYLKNNKEI